MIHDLSKLEEILGYQFNNKELLSQAVTHSSYANEKFGDALKDNERLEFLGDAALDMIISRELFGSEISKAEGDLTKLRASIVCEKSLAKISRENGLNEFLLLGHGEENSGGRQRDSIVADGVEALLGAIYLDSDLDTLANVMMKFFTNVIEEARQGKLSHDSKTELQERLQALGSCVIEYKEIEESGPDHDKSFVFAVYNNGQLLGKGSGKSKKEAQAMAADNALKGL